MKERNKAVYHDVVLEDMTFVAAGRKYGVCASTINQIVRNVWNKKIIDHSIHQRFCDVTGFRKYEKAYQLWQKFLDEKRGYLECTKPSC